MDTAIAIVSAAGLVQGVAAGSVTINATTQQTQIVGTATVTVTSPPPPPPPPPPAGTETLIAAGDIAVCPTSFDEATADLIDNIPGTVALLGDNAYPSGTTANYANCYHPSWGRHKARTRPSIGNHEYGAGATPYFAYFGAAAGPAPQGYYSYDLGNWHVVVLNSNCVNVSCSVGSPQEKWLRADLAATTKACILAYWHHPRFSSDVSHGSNTTVAPFWNALYQYRADVVLNGHAHVYERFGLQNPSAAADANGIREFIVGTGGKSPFYGWGTIKANSQVRHNATFGVLKLTLGAGTYSWNFVPVAGKTWTDSGTTACH
ncbi:MAG: metallophosphoesterase [Cytophagaceae bacterium]|nr:metallophosphoesterase [Gemmatimonadaceae bacterium]